MLWIFIIGVLMNIEGNYAKMRFGNVTVKPNFRTYAIGTQLTLQFQAVDDYSKSIERYLTFSWERVAEVVFNNGALVAKSERILPGTSWTTTLEMEATTFNKATGLYTFTLKLKGLKRSDNGVQVAFDDKDILVLRVRPCVNVWDEASDVIVRGTHKFEGLDGDGHCSCRTGFGMINSTHSLPELKDCTSCSSQGVWKPLVDKLSCWFAPNPVTLTTSNGSFSGNIHDKITLSCNYADVTPTGSKTLYYIGHFVETAKGTTLDVNLTKDLNGQLIFCQPVTPITILPAYNASARSLTHNITVAYPPSFANLTISATTKFIIENKILYLGVTQNVLLQCVHDGNPANCDFTICGRSCADKSAPNNDCQLRVDIKESGRISCQINNLLGMKNSSEKRITLVPTSRRPVLIMKSGRLSRSSSRRENATLKIGGNITLSCSVAYGNELSSVIRIYYPDGRYEAKSSTKVPTLTGTHSGSYRCTTVDKFATLNSNPIYLTVEYRPEQIQLKVEAPKFVVNDGHKTHYIRNDQTVTANCSSKATPKATCAWKVCGRKGACRSLNNTKCTLLALPITDYGKLTCVASNKFGSIASDEHEITLIPQTRKPTFKITSNSLNPKDYALQSGKNITVKCEVDFDTALDTKYTITLPRSNILKVSSFIIPSLSLSNAGTYVCKTVDTMGTFSTSLAVEVKYRPKNVRLVVVKEKNIIEMESSLYYVRSDQTVTLTCNSQADPVGKCFFTLCSLQHCLNITAASHGCTLRSWYPTDTTKAFCVSYNLAGVTKSKESVLIKVPAIRTPTFVTSAYDNSKFDANTRAFEYRSYVTILCNISFQEELETKFTITDPRSITVSNYTIHIPSLTNVHDGKYICNTKDALGSFEKILYVRVKFPPFQGNRTLCHWFLGRPETCEVAFWSHPHPEFVSLTKDGIDMHFDAAKAIRSEGKLSYFTFWSSKMLIFTTSQYFVTCPGWRKELNQGRGSLTDCYFQEGTDRFILYFPNFYRSEAANLGNNGTYILHFDHSGKDLKIFFDIITFGTPIIISGWTLSPGSSVLIGFLLLTLMGGAIAIFYFRCYRGNERKMRQDPSSILPSVEYPELEFTGDEEELHYRTSLQSRTYDVSSEGTRGTKDRF